jgi:uncharacterized protein YdeI (YjbR/CyaY-like superfamily)
VKVARPGIFPAAMVTRDPRIDAYIENAPEFARPVLVELRARVHAACPEVTETMKWRTPSFELGGLLGGLAAFKHYCSFGFWKEPLLREDPALRATVEQVGKVTAVGELPTKAAFAKVLKRAAELNASGAKVPRAKPKTKAEIAAHPEFAKALAASKKASAQFAAFPPSAQREYLEWVADAKKDDTRARRIEQAIEWIAAGKHRNWKYERC